MKGLFITVVVLLGLLNSSLVAAAFTEYSDSEILVMHRVYKQHNANINLNEVKQRLYENQFLLRQAQQRMPEQVKRQSSVGFSTEYHVERYLINLFDSQLKISVNKPAQPKFKDYNKQWLVKNLGQYPSDGSYSNKQITKMQQTDLTQLLNSPMNLYEFIAALSMQMRFRLHQGDINLFKSELIKKQQFYAKLNKATPRFSKQGISIMHLYELAKADILRPSIQSWLGIKSIMHGQSPVLEKFEAQINDKEIKAYYQANKARFRYLSNVKAYGAEFIEKEHAVAFRKAALTQTFVQALATTKQQDIYAKYNGKLTRQNKSNWAVQLAFTSKEQTISAVIRSPKGKWVVIYSFEHNYQFFTVEDETVRYQAKKELAIEKAKQQYHANWLAWQKKYGVIL